MELYEHKKIEQKWREKWDASGVYKTTEDADKEKFYILDMFPYLSGVGLHVGHPKGYIATDIIARYKKMKGFNVLHPMGWDAFGLPAEQFAIKNKIHPSVAAQENIATFKKQIEKISLNYDWDREFSTTDPDYYKWTQWTFLQMFKKGLVYRSHEPINWCPSCKTGLANEDLEDGACERCSTPIEKKKMPQWVIKITDYADRMLADLDGLDWQENIKQSQRNWIGRSEGAEIEFRIKNEELVIKVFTTRPDTLFGCTYMVLSPEHELIDNEKLKIKNWDEVQKYQKQSQKKTEIERTAEGKEKSGVKLEGVTVINPVSNKEIPIYIADYVLSGYGTGAIMAVPAHDQRDFEFAKKYNLNIKEVILPNLSLTSEQVEMIESYEKVVDNYKDRSIEALDLNSKKWIDTAIDDLGSDSKVCEIGAGSGWLSEYLVEKGCEVTATEVSELLVQEVHKGDYAIKKVNIILDPIGMDRYDGIFAASVLHHITRNQIRPVLKKLYRALTDGGILAFRLQRGEGHEVRLSHGSALAFYQYWDLNELETILEDCGFSIEEALDSEESHISFVIRKNSGNDIFTEAGILKNSGEFDGMTSEAAMKKITEKVEGEMTISYKLRDWVFGRQRYWGEPIPLVHCEKCEVVPVPEEELPLLLPDVEHYEPTDTGESPLAGIDEWVNTECPKCGGPARRETDTMPQWAGSSWYYLRYIDPKNNTALVDPQKEKYWSPVDFYVGGAEHATRHLIYARFWHKFLFDIGVVSHDEPFAKLQTVGLIMAKDGRKMSKRWGNVINPDDVIERFGADTFRTYEMFMGPFDASVAWNTEGMIGPRKFLERVWKIYYKDYVGNETPDALKKTLHKTIKKVGDDIEEMKYNTAISAMMILSNEIDRAKNISQEDFGAFLKILCPFAPHMTQELWEQMGNTSFLIEEKWPVYDEKYLSDDEIELVVQVNGKVRDKIMVAADIAEDDAKEKALASEKVQKFIDGKKVRKVIFVQGKLVSIVV